MASFFITILVVYVFWLVVKPLLSRYLHRRFQRKVEDMIRNAYGIPREDSGDGHSNDRQPHNAPPRRRRKIFSADEGEYIEFQETIVEVTAETETNPSGHNRAHTPAEPRVSDAEWEEI